MNFHKSKSPVRVKEIRFLPGRIFVLFYINFIFCLRGLKNNRYNLCNNIHIRADKLQNRCIIVRIVYIFS